MYKVLVSFSGLIVGRKGEVIEIKDNYIATDLLRAGYVEKVSSSKASKEKTPKKTKK